MSRLKRLSRVGRLRGLQALPNLSGHKKRSEKARIQEGRLPTLGDTDNFINDVARLYGDRALAGRIAELKKQFPGATVPELVVYDWLRWRNIPFDYQVAMFGGWGQKGGLVPDFVLMGDYVGRALQIQGDYWHGNVRKQGQDMATKMRLLGSFWNGHQITSVTNIWEINLKNPATRNKTLDMALAGVEMPGA